MPELPLAKPQPQTLNQQNSVATSIAVGSIAGTTHSDGNNTSETSSSKQQLDTSTSDISIPAQAVMSAAQSPPALPMKMPIAEWQQQLLKHQIST